MLLLSVQLVDTDMLKHDTKNGFTLVEIMVAIVMLTVGILGLSASSSKMLEPTNSAETEFIALQYVVDRISEIRMDPRYGLLDSIYVATESTLPGLAGAQRVTAFARTRNQQGNGKWIDYWTVTVTVSGGRVPAPIARSLILAAP